MKEKVLSLQETFRAEGAILLALDQSHSVPVCFPVTSQQQTVLPQFI